MSVKGMSGKKKFALIIGAAIVILGAYFLFFKKSKSKIVYNPTKVTRENLSVVILSTGTVQPENRLDIKAPIAGRAEQVLVDEGYPIKKGQVLAWMSSSERAAMIDAARAEGPAALKKWENLYRPTPVMAPIDGTVIARNVEPGQTFTNADSIIVMSDRLIVEAQVDETDIAQIKLKSKATIILDAYSKDEIPATVHQIAFEAKTVNNVTGYIVKVLPDTVPDFMRAGMTANINFDIESKEDVLTVDNEAIIVEKEGKYLLAADAKGKPIARDAEFGMTDGRRTEVISGVTEGETVFIQSAVEDDSSSASNPFRPKMNRKKKR